MRRKCAKCGAMQVITVDFDERYLDMCEHCGYSENVIIKKDFVKNFECFDCGSLSGRLEENTSKLGVRCNNCGKLHIMLEKHSDEDLRTSEKYLSISQTINSAKCPTCQSTNIQKISAGRKLLGGLGFGLMSKTATSQFECKNCGYKW